MVSFHVPLAYRTFPRSRMDRGAPSSPLNGFARPCGGDPLRDGRAACTREGVVVEEMVTEAHKGDTSSIGPVFLTAGFALFAAISVYVGP